MCQFHTLSRRVLLAGASGSAAALALPGLAEAVSSPRTWAIVGATVIDSMRPEPIRDAVIVVVGDRIVWVGRRGDRTLPPGIEIVDGRGKYVIPGLVEMHHHLGGATVDEQAANLRGLLGFGVTSVFDPAVALADLAALKATGAPSPRLFGTGPMLATPGGWGDLDGPAFRVVPDPAAAAGVVDEFAATGVDAIKVANDDIHWGGRNYALMPVDVQRAIVAAARRHRIPVFFHAPALAQAAEALQAGAAGLLHGIVDRPVDRAFLRLLKGRSYVDTMALFETVGDVVGFAGRQQAYDRRGLYPASVYDAIRSPEVIAQIEFLVDPPTVRSHLPTLRANVRPIHDSGANVAFGCDGGFLGQALGIASQLELVMHGQAGLSPHQVIRGATLGGARMLSQHHRIGSLTPGKLADLVVLSANPLADLANLHYVDFVARSGQRFHLTTR